MTRVTLPVDQIQVALAGLKKRIDVASSSVPSKGEIPLEIPEPYDHAVKIGPEVKSSCFSFDECGEIGILLGVESTRKRDKKGPKARRKAPRRK